jgi:hypothetical protein
MRLFDREPDKVTRGDRRVTMDWVVGESPGRDGPKRHIVSLTVSYSLGGVNYFSGGMIPRGYSAAIRTETEEQGKWGTSRSFMVFQGLGGIYSEAAARFNRKNFEAAVPKALARLREIQDHPKVQEVIEQARVEAVAAA